jgi:hypothetical protein
MGTLQSRSNKICEWIRWLLAATLVVSFSTFGIAQSSKENPKSATKVYAYYNSDEPRFGTPDWWHMKAERFSADEGSAP